MAGQALKQEAADISQLRGDFPMLSENMNGKPLAYLDTAASAQKPALVIDAMRDVMSHHYSNIHRGLYQISQSLTHDYETVRGKIGEFIGANSERSIVFTRNATEGINLVAQSWGRTHLRPGDEIIVTEMEHHANIVPWQLLCEQNGLKLKFIPILEDGDLDLDAFRGLLSTKTRFVSVVHISNALGTINPINEIIRLVRDFSSDIKILVDGSQGIVHSPVHMGELDCDFYVFTGHKLYGPTGIGVLYGKEELLNEMPPYQGGGDMIERVAFEGTTYKPAPHRFEAGTPAIVEVIGLGAAIDYLTAANMPDIQAHEERLSATLLGMLKAVRGVRVYGSPSRRAGIVPFSVDGLHSGDVAMILDQCGVAVRTGHHCCMPLMKRLGVDGTLRASIGLYSNEKDIEALVAGLEKARKMLS